MNYFVQIFCLLFCLISFSSLEAQQHSVAREWNESLLFAIRNDFARPTVHARNLWHTSVAMYEAWAAYEENASQYFLGKEVAGYYCPFSGVSIPTTDKKSYQEKAMSYAAYRVLKHRFKNSPGFFFSFQNFDNLFLNQLGLDSAYHSTDYSTGSPAALGNYIAQEIIAFGMQDGANEATGYDNDYYMPVNPTLLPMFAGNPGIIDPNRWQPLTLNVFIDQSGNIYPINTPTFLSPEWGNVIPFALDSSNMVTYNRNGGDYNVYYNVPAPPLLDTLNGGSSSDLYKWGFRLVSKWSSHLDTVDGVMWDISPASIGNISWYPETMDSLPFFYNEDEGGDFGTGYTINPHTGQPYAPQMVPRADYARVLAEFWADGPDSETPPGHWFTILNYVSDHPLFEKKWRGQGPVLDDLEWDIKSYFTLAGAMHDAAITAWTLKGWHDYIRPVSAIRYMADRGQSTDPALPNYDMNGIELDSGYVEIVDSLDPLAGVFYQHVGKIKVKAWKGPDYINNPMTDMAGVDWILAENWWPYQRPSFVTPPFAGFVSGHSTYSRAAADVMTLMTGDEYFPGGMGEFNAPQNSFLVFEEGPSTNVVLQWATYRDASDQCSLSRIWGGIHPPADDVPGRLLGMKVGAEAYELARSHWDNSLADVIELEISDNLLTDSDTAQLLNIRVVFDEDMNQNMAPQISFPVENPGTSLSLHQFNWENSYTVLLSYQLLDLDIELENIDIQISGAQSVDGHLQNSFMAVDLFSIETKNPILQSIAVSTDSLLPSDIAVAGFSIQLTFDEKMDMSTAPTLSFPVENANAAINYNVGQSGWQSDRIFNAVFDVFTNLQLENIDVAVFLAQDEVGNIQQARFFQDQFSIIDPTITTVHLNEDNNLQVFPNPLKMGQSLHLSCSASTFIEHIKVLDVDGKLIFQEKVHQQLQNYSMNTQLLSSGNFILEIKTNKEIIQKQLLILP